MGDVLVSAQQLTVLDENIVLGSAGFWSLLSADDAALRSHFTVKVPSAALSNSVSAHSRCFPPSKRRSSAGQLRGCPQ